MAKVYERGMILNKRWKRIEMLWEEMEKLLDLVNMVQYGVTEI